MNKSFMLWFLPLSMLCMAGSCDSCMEEPTVSTAVISAVTPTSAVSGGDVTSDGGATVTERGVCWNTTTSPTIANNKSSDGTGTGVFTSNLSNLSPGITYYVKAYATNSKGTGYGSEFTFTTEANLSAITTTAATAVTTTSATSGGNITTDGGGAITARGVCWSTTINPMISNSKTTDGTGTGSFLSSITGLTPGSKYYVRAYATNSAVTSYGNEISFTVLANLPTVTTTAASAITAATATSGGNITADGGGVVTARGVCWSTTAGPTIANVKTSDGTGTGIFTSSLTSLTANTTYYVRAYATNSAGTVYGNEISFRTLANLPTVITTAISSIASTSATGGGNVTDDGRASILARGVCWGTTTAPTITNSNTSDGYSTGAFTSSLTSLIAGTTYYVRAYATNIAGTAYGNEISFTTTSTSGITITDVDGNTYSSVIIGTQTWMKENLKTTKFNDGTAILPVTDYSAWLGLTTPAYCWYNNDASTYKDTYGALYNWYTVNTGKLCPSGWHVPNINELTTLIEYLGGENVAGGKLKETGTIHWRSPNAGATNSSGFTALPGGYRTSTSITPFDSVGYKGYWWSSSPSADNAWYCVLFSGDATANKYYSRTESGFSVRCVKN
ncbi:MAG: fibrobacter succinogenes major paralogous domain-containing protein [Bacteroidota bacterium]